MSQGQEDTDVSSIYDLEIQLQEKLSELQWKSKALEETQLELSQVRQNLLNKDLELEEKNRTIVDLRMQLATTNRVVEWIEKEKSKCTSDRIQLQINCDAALKERDSLLQQTHSAKMENVTLRLDVQRLTEQLAMSENSRKSLEASLTEMQERFSQVNNTLQSNISKLEKEHQSLLKSVESTIHLNKRLQTVGLCAHAVFTKKDNEIKELQRELSSKEQTVVEEEHRQLIDYNSNVTPTDTKILVQQIRMDKEKSNKADKEVEAVLTEFEKVYPNNDST